MKYVGATRGATSTARPGSIQAHTLAELTTGRCFDSEVHVTSALPPGAGLSQKKKGGGGAGEVQNLSPEHQLAGGLTGLVFLHLHQSTPLHVLI